ncbi:MAG TPA: DUF2249 domain-containing protein [Longimicrobiaceae bacterium]|nr:DUF2249 domain-containing protein [Longimicrobiaceae bacterium]
MIGPRERVAKVLARDERLVEVFAAASPAFARLRSPAMRRVMARLVTVEQAARIAGVAPERLLENLNRALEGGAGPPAATAPREEEHAMRTTETVLPPELADIAPERVHDLDVRDDLRGGREPFSRIMEARRALPPGDVLRLRAIFEPVPLYAVMAKQGLEHWTERLADDDWRVWFFGHEQGAGSTTQPAAPRQAAEAGSSESDAGPADADVIVLDVRGLEPPEPMVRTLEALEALPAGKTLLQVNQRVPRFLLPELEARGFRHEVREQSEDLVRIFIRRAE